MKDHSESKAVRLQAMTILMAALITTSGAITAAFIQSGWIRKPAIAPILATEEPLAQPEVALTSFTANTSRPLDIVPEPIVVAPAVNRAGAVNTSGAANTPAAIKFTGELQTATETQPVADVNRNLQWRQPAGVSSNVSRPAALPAPSIASAAPQAETVMKVPTDPALLQTTAINTTSPPVAASATPPTKVIASPWGALASAAPTQKPADPPKTSSKIWGWDSVTRIFSGR